MTLRRLISEAVETFNERQVETGRDRLTSVESNMLVSLITAAVQVPLAELRSELEDAAAGAELETQRELEWATDIIIATLLFDDKTETTIKAEKIMNVVGDRKLKVEHDQGDITLKVVG